MEVDLRDVNLLNKIWDESPRKFEYAVSRMLNDMAFGSRKEIIDYGIPKTMIVRNKGYVRKFVRVKKAVAGLSLNNIYSTVFSVEQGNVTGWEEQEYGLEDKRPKVPLTKARGGNRAKKVLDKFRMKKGTKFPNPKNYPGKNLQLKNVIMLQILSRTNVRQPFIIKGHKDLKSGLYKFEEQRGGNKWRGNQKLRMLQKFKHEKSTIDKKPWMELSVRKYIDKGDWFENFEEFLITGGFKRFG
jgi:hypothetical protein